LNTLIESFPWRLMLAGFTSGCMFMLSVYSYRDKDLWFASATLIASAVLALIGYIIVQSEYKWYVQQKSNSNRKDVAKQL